MNVTVKAFADVRELLGPELLISIPEGKTVRQLLQMLDKKNTGFLLRVLESDGLLRPYVIILKNGDQIVEYIEQKKRIKKVVMRGLHAEQAGFELKPIINSEVFYIKVLLRDIGTPREQLLIVSMHPDY
jgi:molybdopterin converting factor small subunit